MNKSLKGACKVHVLCSNYFLFDKPMLKWFVETEIFYVFY